MFAQPGKKEKVKEKSEVPAEVVPPPATVTAPPVEEEPVVSPPITRPVIVRPPLPEDQQREIFKWMLEEKRKVKPKSRDEKQHIDEEKAILKEFYPFTVNPKHLTSSGIVSIDELCMPLQQCMPEDNGDFCSTCSAIL
ncbi:UNVERIFIED_CONTAM: hypothetical protein Sangu_1418000 [Sesamum angustifolium]|uniref:Uncharacterized protein n=1 Tax=Sesamum angustifolium TaxID=2727405 RepID=A0AAW2N5V3_9LAMI